MKNNQYLLNTILAVVVFAACAIAIGISRNEPSVKRGTPIGTSWNRHRSSAQYAANPSALAFWDTCEGVLATKAAYPAARLRNASLRYSTAPDSIDSALPKRSTMRLASVSVMSRSSPVSGSNPTQTMSPKTIE